MPSSPTANLAAPNVNLLFGPMLIGAFLNTLLYGVMIVQASTYQQRYKHDRPWFRYLVLYLFIAETVNWVCDVGLIYEPLIFRFGTLEALRVSPLLLRADAALTGMISTPIQFFIAWRVRVVTHSAILPAIICILSVISLGGAVATSTAVSLHPAFADFPTSEPMIIVWLIATTACDVFLTCSLVYSLWVRKTNVISTDSYINKIIRLTVQTGVLTAGAALLDMILFLTLPGTAMNFMIDFPLSKLYTISLISTLNARAWKEHNTEHDAPNVLFEQTPVATTSFNLATRPSTFYAQHPMYGHSQDSYTTPVQRSKFTMEIESMP
ncbi:hypothetical protein FB451DRAFT_1241919 [Mycena latifolia]|nr:hypothetical protein FB451DRAFT_1241919 [Mycena latifolia]